MYRLAVFCLFAITSAQNHGSKYAGDPRIASILQEQRYLSGDGTFGAAYQQEDGINFKEESDADGNRKGSYSYIDPSGQRRTISYTAGKDGFRASGDHLPVAPEAPAAPQVAPQPQYNPAPASARQYSPAPAGPSNYNPNEDDGQYHPELYENENYVAPAAPQRSYSSGPAQFPSAQPAPQYQAQNIYPGVQQSQYSGVPQQSYTAAPAPASRQYYEPSTPPPHRFFPPGEFNLNRSPDGYTYTFKKV